MEEKRIPFTVAEVHELAQRRADEWHSARAAAYQADPTGTYPMHKFEHASDQNYQPGPPSTKIEFHGMDESPSPYPRGN